MLIREEDTMDKHLVFHLPNSADSGRNSEGSFLRAPNGDILFAYSHFNTSLGDDDDPCDISLIRSHDEGETWSTPEVIARASDFGVKNIMSVSGLTLKDGSLCFFFIVKEDKDGSSHVGRAVSQDGIHFTPMTCAFDHVQRGYYVFNNDRFIRLSDGRIAAAASKYSCAHTQDEDEFCLFTEGYAMPVCFVSDDEGASFKTTRARIALSGRLAQAQGMEEPGIIELKNGVIWLWARTMLCYQYQCFSLDGMDSFTPPEPSVFTSPRAPMELYRTADGTIYAIYNPVPHYNGVKHKSWLGRTPFVLRSSHDDGKTWSDLYTIEDDANGNYAYPAMFETRDHALLCGYMSGHCDESDLSHIISLDQSLKIMKISLDK